MDGSEMQRDADNAAGQPAAGDATLSVAALIARQAALGAQLAQTQASLQYHEQQAAVARTNIDQIMASLIEVVGLVSQAQQPPTEA